MHLESRKMAMVGILLAICVLCVYGGTVIESNTLLCISVASFGIGIVIHDYGMRMGVAFFVASIALTFLLVPIKMYSVTLAAMELYLIVKHGIQDKLGRAYGIVKYVVFNILYVPALVFFPTLVYSGKISPLIMFGIWAGGQIVFTVYDIFYNAALERWERFKKHAEM